ncbi:MAG: DUF6268 family outer membrane beta-barrel protein [Marinoscillum sp.]
MTHFYRSLLNILCGLLLLISTPSMSQDLQLAGFSFTRLPGAEVMNVPQHQEVEVNEYNFFLNLPKQLKNEKTLLINGFQYRLVTPFMDNDLNLGIDGKNLHLIGYRLTVLHQLSNDWKVLVSLNPTLSSTFNTSLEKDDFLMNGALLFTKKMSDQFSYGGGIAYLSSFGEPRFIPTLQVTLTSEKSKLHLLLPRRITYDCYFGKFTVGLKAEASGSRYNVNYTRTNPFNDTELADMLIYSRVVLGPSLKYCVGKHIELEVSGGMAVARKMELQGDLFEDAHYNTASGPFFSFGISIVPNKQVDDRDK